MIKLRSVGLLGSLAVIAACAGSNQTIGSTDPASVPEQGESAAVVTSGSAASASGFDTDYMWQVAADVDPADVAFVRDSLAVGESYFRQLGLTGAEFSRRNVIIHLIKDGNGTSTGACCAASLRSGGRAQIVIDTAHWRWQRAPDYSKLDLVVHELWHTAQFQLDAVDRMPLWMLEGSAVVLPKARQVQTGERSWAQMASGQVALALHGRSSAGQLEVPLQRLSSRGSTWPGTAGALALIGAFEETGTGPEDILRYTRLVGQGQSHDRAFLATFGISSDALYERFEVWRQRVLADERSEPIWSKLD